MSEIVAAEKWMVARLLAESALTAIIDDRVVSHVVRDEVEYPLVLITMASAAENYTTLEGNVIWSPLVYAVRIVDRVESYEDLEAGANAIKAALHRQSGSNDSGEVVSCLYQAPFATIELDRDGAEMRALGGLYRPTVR